MKVKMSSLQHKDKDRSVKKIVMIEDETEKHLKEMKSMYSDKLIEKEFKNKI